jgi:tetratricopeptide (TPR) repeat protein
MILSALALAALVSATGEPEGAETLFRRIDAAYAERDRPGKLDELRAGLAEAEKRWPGDYGVLWRQAELLCWLADEQHQPDAPKSRLGRECWDVAEKAIAARPGGVEGWFLAAQGAGNYSLGIGILTALAKGMEGKFKERLARAQAIDPGYQSGGIDTAWGRFYYELPWPKYDAEKSERFLRKALERNPRNMRALVYLAELYAKEDRAAEGRALLERAAALEPGAYDAPEERRWQERARELLAAPAARKNERRER